MTKKRKSKTHLQSHLRNVLRDAKRPLSVLSDTRNSASVSEYKDILGAIYSNPFLKTRLFPNNYPRTIRNLRMAPLMGATTTVREFRWASANLRNHVSQLSEFVALSKTYSQALLADNHSRCNEALDDIEKKFGQSLWLIKNRISFFQRSGGLERQKQYAARIRQEAQPHGMAAYVAYYVSIRNESAISPARFTDVFDHHTASLHLDSEVEVYVRQHVHPRLRLTEGDLGTILRFEFANTVIDYYEMLLKMCQMAVCSDYQSLFADISAVLHMVSSINDSRIEILLFEMDGTKPTNQTHNARAIHTFDRFLEGEGVNIAEIISGVTDHSDQIDELEILARPTVYAADSHSADSKSFISDILSKMATIAALGENVDEAMAGLQKIWMNFSSQPWANTLLDFVRKEGQPEPPDIAEKVRHFAAANTPFLHPTRVGCFPGKKERVEYTGLLEEVYGSSPSIMHAQLLSKGPAPDVGIGHFSKEEQQLVTARSALYTRDFATALEESTMLAASSDPYYQKHAGRLKTVCLLELDRLDECVRVMTQAFVRRPNLHHVLPIARLAELIDAEDRIRLSSDLSLAICFDMYSKHVDMKFDEFRAYAYEDFLISKGLERPSQMSPIINALDLPSAVYFLKNICVEQVMDTSTAFESSKEVTEERLSVLKILVDIDPQNVDDYHNEIKEIQSRLMIKRRLREVEQSKIYVDVDGIKQKVDKNMRESFSRYLSYLKHGLDADSAEFREVARKKALEGDIQGLLSLTLPQNEMNELFRSMVVELRDEFVSSAEHGLNWFLSVRIRHGTFSGHLRSPLEAAALVTQRDRSTGEYKPNIYWLQRLQIEDPNDAAAVIKPLADFSKNFDDLVQEILSDWLQIKKEPNDSGLFNFTLTEPQVDLMSSQITEHSTYERFLDDVFSLLTSRLASNLESIRYRIEREAERRVDQLLNALLLEISQLADSVDTRDLSNAITAARTEMHIAFDRVIEWFRLARATAFEPFLIEDAINISVESVRTFSPSFTADLSIGNEGFRIPFHGKQLSTVVDIFFIVFENIVRHSDANPPHANVTVTYQKNSIQFRVENPVASNVATDRARARVEALKAVMRERQATTSFSTEGGTGLLKIWRIIAHDFGEEPQLDFGFMNDITFFVDFNVFTKEQPL